jgi:hypothetical protein
VEKFFDRNVENILHTFKLPGIQGAIHNNPIIVGNEFSWLSTPLHELKLYFFIVARLVKTKTIIIYYVQ